MRIKPTGVCAGFAVAIAVVFAPASLARIDRGTAPPPALERPDRVVKNPRLESRLARVAAASPAQALAIARRGGLDVANGRVRVMVEGSSARAAVVAGGGTVESAVEGLVEALVAPAALERLSRARGVTRVRAPFHAVPLGIDSQGVAATSASAWHAAGATGAGAKVAVIDLGFADYTARQASGDLPAGLITQDHCGGMGAPEPHGTAVAEIVHEMAPAAQLYLICINSEADLKLAAEYAKANAITIVNHSVGWFNTSRGDGSGGPTTPDAIVADARENGILWVNSAGNAAQAHWSGPFSGGGDTFLDWIPGDETNTLFIAAGRRVCGFLKWDSWPTTRNDYDLYLARHSDGVAVAASFEDQSGLVTGGPPLSPTEGFCYVAPTSEFYFFAIDEFSASGTPRLDFFVTVGNAIEYTVPGGSITEPATSPHAFAAGAICWLGGGLEPYSSQGPTIDGRTKPDLVGPAAVTSGVYGAFSACGSSGFTGTSASAPHVAGAAALWKGLLPSAPSDVIRARLESNAFDFGPGGPDNSFGFGSLNLPTLKVSTTADGVDSNLADGNCAGPGGPCTLRAAVQEANAQPGPQVISIPAGTYTLTLTGTSEDAAATGDLDVTDDLLIAGAAGGSTILDGGDVDRLFHVACASCDVSLSHLVLQNGKVAGDGGAGDGGAILNAGSLDLNEVAVGDSTAARNGGGIANLSGAVLAIADSGISGNLSDCAGGNGAGGGIWNAGTLTMSVTKVALNIANCHAGGVSNVSGGTATITDATFFENEADDGAGLSNAGTATVSRTTFDANDAYFAFGGGIFNSGTLTLTNSTLSENEASLAGGGIFANGGAATITNTTISGNLVAQDPRGIVKPVRDGGGIYIAAGTVSLKNTILAYNQALPAGTDSNCATVDVDLANPPSAPTSLGNNIDDSTTCALPVGSGNRSATDPKLGALTDNGGLTHTHALLGGSPAIDGGDNAACPATDQRGATRPTDGDGNGTATCDIGAFESAAVAPPPPPPPPPPPGGGGGGLPPDLTLTIGHSPATVAVGETFTYTFAVANKTNGLGTQMNLVFTLPDRVEFVTALFERGTGCRLSSGQTYVCFLDFLSGFQSTAIRVIVRVREAGELRVTGSLALAQQDQNPADNTATYSFTVQAPFTPPVTPPTQVIPPAGVTKTGSPSADTIYGAGGPDTLRGLGGPDRLFGRGGSDRLFGGAGNDYLAGGAGRDLVEGGPGSDTIVARDKTVDTIRCGRGRDKVTADRIDRVARDCEVVRRS